MEKRVFATMAAVAVMAFVTAGGVAAGDEVYFAYKYEAGSSQNYEIKFNQEVDFGQFSMSALIDMEITENCVEVNDSTFTMEWTFNKVDASRVMFENLQTDPMSENLANKKVMFEVDPSGEISEVRPVDYIEGWQQAEDTVTRIIESSFPSLPDRTVEKGKDWTENESDTSDEGTEYTSDGKFVYKENKQESGRECAVVEGEVALTIGGRVSGPQGVMNADGDGKGEVEIYFDSAAGVVVKLKSKVGINMTMTPPDGGDSVETSVGFETEKKLK